MRVDHHGAVATVSLHNPPLNLLTVRIRSQLRAAFAALRNNDNVRAVVLTAAGDRAFSAGSDVREFPCDADAGRARARDEHACCDDIAGLPQPVVAALHGHTLGGGLELALACDVRIADTGTKIGLPESKLGLFPSGGGTQRLSGLAPSTAKKMVFLGDTIDVAEARRLQLVDDVVPRGQAHTAATQFAHEVAARPARAIRAAKQALNHAASGGSFATGREIEIELIAELFTSYDAQEGVAALLGSRPPEFQHR